MPARKNRGNNRPKSSQKNNKKGSDKSFLKFLFSGPVILALICVIAICLVIAFWPLINTWFNQLGDDIRSVLNNAWIALYKLMGLGVVFAVISFIGICILIGWPRTFLRHWNYWAGSACFMAALWGILSYLRPSTDSILAQVTMGGYIGQSIATPSLWAGILIIGLLLLLAIFFIAPEWLWRAIKGTARGGAGAVGEVVDVVKESRNNGKKAAPVEKIEEEKPAIPPAPEPEPAHVDTAVMDRMRSSIQVGGWSLPNINILDKIAAAVSYTHLRRRRCDSDDP